eukprot:scaffold4749_cov148-Chaetoceros_neogracile.AAC.1
MNDKFMVILSFCTLMYRGPGLRFSTITVVDTSHNSQHTNEIDGGGGIELHSVDGGWCDDDNIMIKSHSATITSYN